MCPCDSRLSLSAGNVLQIGMFCMTEKGLCKCCNAFSPPLRVHKLNKFLLLLHSITEISTDFSKKCQKKLVTVFYFIVLEKPHSRSQSIWSIIHYCVGVMQRCCDTALNSSDVDKIGFKAFVAVHKHLSEAELLRRHK